MSDDFELGTEADLPEMALPEPLSPEEERRERGRANLAKARATAKANREARAASPDLDSPEFQAAVAAAASKVVAELMAGRNEVPAVGPAIAVPAAGDMAWARQLAQAMAEVADQGTDRKRLAPEVLAQRTEARDRMEKLIIAARVRGDLPVYQLRNKVQMKIGDKGEAVVEPIWRGNDKIHYPTEIEWQGVPNQEMIPMDDTAREIYQAFTESIGNVPIVKQVEGIAMTPSGAVVRGGAAAALFRATGRAPELGGPAPMGDAATIRRHQPAQTREIRVLGTLHAPARENA